MELGDINYIVVFITSSNIEEANKISSELVEKKIVACVNVVPSVKSVFRWQGKVCNEDEVLLVAKTRLSAFGQLKSKVQELHSYDVPEIIAMPIIAGSEDYLEWLGSETRCE